MKTFEELYEKQKRLFEFYERGKWIEKIKLEEKKTFEENLTKKKKEKKS